jgi:hypothetical protein
MVATAPSFNWCLALRALVGPLLHSVGVLLFGRVTETILLLILDVGAGHVFMPESVARSTGRMTALRAHHAWNQAIVGVVDLAGAAFGVQALVKTGQGSKTVDGDVLSVPTLIVSKANEREGEARITYQILRE